MTAAEHSQDLETGQCSAATLRIAKWVEWWLKGGGEDDGGGVGVTPATETESETIFRWTTKSTGIYFAAPTNIERRALFIVN